MKRLSEVGVVEAGCDSPCRLLRSAIAMLTADRLHYAMMSASSSLRDGEKTDTGVVRQAALAELRQMFPSEEFGDDDFGVIRADRGFAMVPGDEATVKMNRAVCRSLLDSAQKFELMQSAEEALDGIGV